ncbi:uncharacterized protein LOC142986594 [Anticarsia gemmatalis]|uniref:uncharacterized protein LOC142986594 n=1 Tax=Anticarsia gemmatalis TaxID=129554 RepID=UPI003F7719B3
MDSKIIIFTVFIACCVVMAAPQVCHKFINFTSTRIFTEKRAHSDSYIATCSQGYIQYPCWKTKTSFTIITKLQPANVIKFVTLCCEGFALVYDEKYDLADLPEDIVCKPIGNNTIEATPGNN